MSTLITLKQPHFGNWVCERREFLERIPSEVIAPHGDFPSRNTYNKIEAGEKPAINHITLQKLANALDTPVHILRNVAAGETIPVNLEIAEANNPLSARVLIAAAIVVAVVLGGFLLWWYVESQTPAALVELKSNGQGILLKKADGSLHDEIDFRADIFEPLIINVDGSKRIIVAVKGRSENYAQVGRVRCFDFFGRDRWVVDTFDEVIMQNHRSMFDEAAKYSRTGHFMIRAYGAGKFFQDTSRTYIWATAHDPFYAPSRFVVIDPLDGKIRYEFWNPGRAEHTRVYDIDQDGVDEVLLGCHSNRFADWLAIQANYDSTFYLGNAILLEPIKDAVARAPFMNIEGFPVTSIEWMAITHPFTSAPEIDIEKHEGVDKAVVRSTGLSFHHWVNYSGRVQEAFLGQTWMNSHGGKQPPPPLVFSFENDSLQIVPTGYEAADIATTLALVYDETKYRMLLKLAGHPPSSY